MAWIATGLWIAAAVGCRNGGDGKARGASSGASPAATAAAPSPGCARLGEMRARLPSLREQGKLDRAARLLRHMAERCPERASDDWPVRVELLAELGRTDELEAIAREGERLPELGAASKKAATRARELARPSAQAADLAGARRQARALYLEATLEPDHGKARDLFLEAAQLLPTAGPALYQAGRAAKRAGDAVESQRLFDRALAALERSTGARPNLRTLPAREGLARIEVGAHGRFAMAATSDAVRVLDSIGWQPRFDHDAASPTAALSADGTLLVMATGQSLLACSLVEASCHEGRAPAAVGALSLDAKGERCAALAGADEVIAYEAATLERRASWRSPAGKVSALALSPDGTLVAVGLVTGGLYAVALDSGEIRLRAGGHREAVTAVAFDPSGKRLVSTDDSSLRLTLLDGGKQDEVGTWDAAREPAPAGLALSADGRTAYLGRNAKVEAWSLEPKEPRSVALALDGFDTAIGVAATHDRLFVGTKAFHPMPWVHSTYGVGSIPLARIGSSAPGEPPTAAVSWGGGALPAVAFDATASTVAWANEKCALTAWDLAKGSFLRRSLAFETYRNCAGLALSADGQSAIGRGPDYLPTRLDLRTGALSPVAKAAMGDPLEPLPKGLPEGARYGIVAGPSVAWVDGSGELRVGPLAGPWRAVGKPHPPRDQEGLPTRELDPSVALSPSGRLAAFRSAPDAAKVVDVATGAPLRDVPRVALSGLAFGPRDELYVAGLDGAIVVACVEPSAANGGATGTDAAAPRPSAVSTPGDAGVSSAAGRGPSDSAAASPRCEERTIRTPGGGPLYSIATVRDGELLAGAVDDGPIVLWSTRDGSLRAALHSVGAGGMATGPDGSAEIFGKVESELTCYVGPFAFGPELCHERLVTEGLLAALLQERPIDP